VREKFLSYFDQRKTLGLVSLSLVWGLLTACDFPRPLPPTRTPTAAPTIVPTPVPEWTTLAPGLEQRAFRIPLPARNATADLIAFRLDPTQLTFRVLYSPSFPHYVSDWDRSALLTFNAGFFDERQVALGLVVSDGQTFGQSFVGFGGMFQVSGGVASLRSLAVQPYQRGEVLEQAAQAFPMLIYPDGTTFAKEDGALARRTALAQDSLGRLYLFIAPRPSLTLVELATALRALDLGLMLALNLDGGGSTGYYAGPHYRAESQTAVPAVIAVYPK